MQRRLPSSGNRSHKGAQLTGAALHAVAYRHGKRNDQGQPHPGAHLLDAADGVVLEPQDVVDTRVASLHGRALVVRPGKARAGARRGDEDAVVGLQGNPDDAPKRPRSPPGNNFRSGNQVPLLQFKCLYWGFSPIGLLAFGLMAYVNAQVKMVSPGDHDDYEDDDDDYEDEEHEDDDYEDVRPEPVGM